MPSLTLDVKHNGVLARRIINGVRDRITFSQQKFSGRHKKWKQGEESALAYLPEREIDAKRRLEREISGKPQLTTIVVPYSYGVLMASHTYWTTVFLSRSPVLQFTGRHGEGEQQVQAIEALMDYQVNIGGMLVPMYIWLLDVGKYGLGVLNVYWDEEEVTVSEIVEVQEMLAGVIPTGRTKKQKQTRKIPGYVGNKVLNVRPYDFFPDPRVQMFRFQEGEFCGSYFELGWNDVIRRMEEGYYIEETVELLKSTGNISASMDRIEGSSQLILPESSDIFGRMGSKRSAEVLKGYECTIELIPKDWGLGEGSSPEKWIFTVDTSFQHVLGAQPLGAFHNKFPYNVLEMEPEGYAVAHRGIPEILEPIQNTVDWLLNTHLYNVRKTINNQFIVDPSRVVMKDITDNAVPGGAIRLKPAAYGSDVRNAITQFPVIDITRNHIADMEVMNQIGQRASGVNDQVLGLLSSGSSRKTATEVRSSNTFGINRLKTTSEYFSAMGWAPLSQMMVQNSQQYYDMDRKFKIVGDLVQEAGQKFINVSPGDIQGFFDLVPVDGTLPVDRFAQANLWRELLGQLRNFPELMMKYDLSRIFGWVAKLAGLKNIDQFRVKMVPDEMAATQAQAGNVVPLGSGRERDLTRVPTGQVSGMGPAG